MSDEYFNHDGEGSGFFSLILLALFLLGGFVVARVYEPGQAIGADAAKERLAKREKIETDSASKLAGIEDVISEVAMAGKEKSSERLIERSIAKDLSLIHISEPTRPY